MTSNPIPNRSPAWLRADSAPEALFRCEVPRTSASWLGELLAREFFCQAVEIERALRPTTGRLGHFLFRVGGAPWVAHVKPDTVPGDLLLAAGITDWLEKARIPVAGYKRTAGAAAEIESEGVFVTVTRYHSGRHPERSIDDCQEVGRGLAELHSRLAEYPGYAAVRRRCSEVTIELRTTRRKLTAGTVDEIPAKWNGNVETAANRYDPKMAFGDGPQQCGHGDLSPGNVLIGESGAVVFCDFEDSAFCFRPTSFDLAMAALRFGLEGGVGIDRSIPRERVEALIGGYVEGGGRAMELPLLRRAVIGLSDHFLLTLSSLAANGTVLDEHEWEKASRWPTLLAVLA